MRVLSAADLLQIWEWGEQRHPIDQALAILAAAYPEQSWEALCDLPLSQRDGQLLACRQAVFGPQLAGYATCPVCGAELEFQLDTAALLQSGPQAAPAQPWQQADLEISFRYPTSRDLAEVIAAGPTPAVARHRLMQRTITGIRRDNQPLELDELAPEAGQAFQEYLLQCEPLLEIQLELDCPACAHHWGANLEITTFFWREIRTYARRLLAEVDALARSYGWSQAEILQLSDRRRAAYLELALQ